ncbi:Abi family protein [Corynebacterium sp. MC-15]|uniref:Abi family protein n=1 Tax=Corynebacterium parakroppenstedtii TaxID=2828363 RepID=UPI001EDBB1F8|nr:Abi family protein [Corynebacterium parakroppenstedtii]MCG2674784.1 Abi family protein [Corynebacterium parakroppenstedtii]
MTGVFRFAEAYPVPKNWLSYDQQVELLRQRGMHIDDTTAAAEYLAKVNYYRFSGYFRYWQHDPARGDNQFFEGTSFETIRALYDAEQELVSVCNELLRPLELLLRTRFAYSYGRLVGVTGMFARGVGFTQSPHPNAERVEEHALSNLDRSKEAFVAHYRDDIKQGHNYKPEAYDRMPIWVAVEAFSFGSLSRLIEASSASGVLDDIADSMNTSRKLLPGQVKSFVYLRNRIAHCAQLWNHRVLDVPGLQPKTTRRIKRVYRKFSDHSIYKVLVALDDVATRSEISTSWLADTIEPILNKHPLPAKGITEPGRYDQGRRPDRPGGDQ